MSTGFPFFLAPDGEELHKVRHNWGWFLALGIALIVLGGIAISFPGFTTLTTIEIFGFLLVGGGVVEVASSIWTRRWGGFFLHLLSGFLYLFLGLVMIDRPALGAVGYTLLLAMFFVAGGLFRVVFALSQRFSGWGWTLVSGVVSFILGIMIWRQLPESALWVVGTFIGIELLFNGWSWVMIGLALRGIPERRSSL